MKKFGIDWGHGKKFVVYDGEKSFSYDKGLVPFIKEFAPCEICIESTCESFFVDKREEIVSTAEELGCKLWSVPTRGTANKRQDRGIAKSDEADAKLMYDRLVAKDVHISPLRRLGGDRDEKLARVRKVAGRRVMALRRQGYEDEAPEECAEVLSFMGEFPTDGPMKTQLCEGIRKVKWKSNLVVPVAVYALETLKAGEGREFFDTMCGLFDHGYPNIVRSNAFYHQLRSYVKQHLPEERLLEKKREKAARAAAEDEDRAYVSPPTPDFELKIRKEGMQKIRAYHRWVWNRVRKEFEARRSGTLNPSNWARTTPQAA